MPGRAPAFRLAVRAIVGKCKEPLAGVRLPTERHDLRWQSYVAQFTQSVSGERQAIIPGFVDCGSQIAARILASTDHILLERGHHCSIDPRLNWKRTLQFGAKSRFSQDRCEYLVWNSATRPPHVDGHPLANARL